MSNQLIGITAVFSLTAFLFTFRYILSSLSISNAKRRPSRMFPNKTNGVGVSNSESRRPFSIPAGASPTSSTGSQVVAITSRKKEAAGVVNLRRIN